MALALIDRHRFAYLILLFLSLVAAYILREHAPSDAKLYSLDDCPNSEPNCQPRAFVLRMCAATTIFFGTLSLSTMFVRSKSEWRYNIHAGMWPVKMIVWIGLHVVVVFIPTDVFLGFCTSYISPLKLVHDLHALCTCFGFSWCPIAVSHSSTTSLTLPLNHAAYVAIVGASLFLIVQLILLIDLAYGLNETLVEKDTQAFKAIVLVLAALAFIGALTLVGLQFHWFAKGKSCGLPTFFIIFNLVLIVLVTVASLFTERGAILTAGIVSFYNTWTVLSALIGQPTCNALYSTDETFTGFNVLTVIGTLCVGGWMCLRSSSQGHAFKTKASTAAAAEDDDVSGGGNLMYSLSFFHLIFVLGSMFVSMQLTNWNEDIGKGIDDSKGSMWIKIASSWLCGLLFLWSMVAPLILKNRDFD